MLDKILKIKFPHIVVFKCKNCVASYTVENTPELEYQALLNSSIEAYKKMALPLCIPLYLDGKAFGMCFDIDRHKGKETVPEEIVIARKSATLQYLDKLNKAVEDSVGGFKIWVLFSEPMDAKLIQKFQKHIIKKCEVEGYPYKKSPIRLPGLYKDYERYSTNAVTNDKLDTFEKVSEFMNNSITDAKVVENYLASLEYTVSDASNKSITVSRKGLSPFDPYFELIWEYVTGKKMPEIDTQISCPFHEDKTPSARLKHHIEIEGKIVFFCNSENCELSTSKDIKIRDAQDIASYFFKTNKYDELLEGLDKIILRLFDRWRYIKNGRIGINFIELSNFIKVDIKRDENNVMYLYTGFFWEGVRNPKQENDIGFCYVSKELEKFVQKWGIWHLGRKGILEITDLVMKKKSLPEERLPSSTIGKMDIPYKNGIYNLELDELRPITKESYIFDTLGCSYNPFLVNSKWQEVLDMYLPNKDSQVLLQEFVGAALLPDLQVSKVLFCYGSGGNGKGTILNIIYKLFDKLCSSISIMELGDKWRVYDLYRKNLNIDSDCSLGTMDAAMMQNLKIITGDGVINIERKFGQPFSCRVTAKFIVACNKIPGMGEVNESISRRFLEIPFTQKVPKNNFGGFWESIVATPEDISGINNWALDGLKRFLKMKKFSSIEQEEQVKAEYYKESDPIYGYLLSIFESDMNDNSKYSSSMKFGTSRLTNNDLKKGVTASLLFTDFQVYANQAGVTSRINLNKFGRSLTNLMSDVALPEKYRSKIKKVRTSSGCIYQFEV